MVICCSWISQSVNQSANDALRTLVGAVLFCLVLLKDGKDAVLALSRPCEHFPRSVVEIACSCVLDDTGRYGSCPGSLFCRGMHSPDFRACWHTQAALCIHQASTTERCPPAGLPARAISRDYMILGVSNSALSSCPGGVIEAGRGTGTKGYEYMVFSNEEELK